jgi:hypothetical protein
MADEERRLTPHEQADERFGTIERIPILPRPRRQGNRAGLAAAVALLTLALTIAAHA